MREIPIRTCLSVLLLCLFGFSASLLADAPDTITFQVCMSPANEFPPIVGLSAVGTGTVTATVTRDANGNITSVTFDTNVSVSGFPANTTFTGFHIHPGVAGTTGGVVINFLAPPNPPTLGSTATGSATFVRRVVADPSNPTLFSFATGLLNRPQNYYLNLHTSVNPSGAIRAQLAPSRMVFRTLMTPTQETPPIADSKAVAVGTTTITVNRDCSGITSAVVDFDVAYDFSPGPVTFTGLHYHRGAAGASGPVVIGSGLGGGNDSITDDDGVGNIFRRVDIPSTKATDLSTINDILNNPSDFYINLHTTVSPGGAVRGQLSTNTFSFMKTMSPFFETPPIPLLSTLGRGIITVTTATNATNGNIISGTVEFNVDFTLPGETTITGLHIHNGLEGVSAPVVISTGISGGSPVTIADPNGTGNITRTVTIASDNTAGVAVLKALLDAPERFYVNLHTTSNPNGLIRAQLDRETFVFRVAMKPENEVPPLAGGVSGPSAAATIAIRPASIQGKTTVATVDFDVSYNFPPPVTFNGLHIHEAPVGVNGPILIDSGLSSLTDQDGIGVLFRRALIFPTSTPALSAIDRILAGPESFYANVHTAQNPGGAARAQLASNVYNFAQVAGGLGVGTTISLKNPSTTSSASGLLIFSTPTGDPLVTIVGDALVPFVIPPDGTAAFNTSFLGAALVSGHAKVSSSEPLQASLTFSAPGFTPVTIPPSTTGSFGFRAVVEVNRAAGVDAAVSVVNTGTITTRVVLSLKDQNGRIIRSKFTTTLAPGQQLSGFLSSLFPGLDNFTGTLSIGNVNGALPAQILAATVIQFGPGRFFVVPTFGFTKTGSDLEEEEEVSRIYQ
ncbi:MAG TPA: CHRD domain-containing protein [Acidobacteriota bacterium]